MINSYSLLHKILNYYR